MIDVDMSKVTLGTGIGLFGLGFIIQQLRFFIQGTQNGKSCGDGETGAKKFDSNEYPVVCQEHNSLLATTIEIKTLVTEIIKKLDAHINKSSATDKLLFEKADSLSERVTRLEAR